MKEKIKQKIEEKLGWNSRVKKTLCIAIIIIFLFIIVSFKISLNSQLFGVFLLISIILLSSSYEDDFQSIFRSIIVLAMYAILIFIMLSWLFGFRVPLINKEFNDLATSTIFTIVIALATIVNVFLYKKSLSLSRLSTLRVDLTDYLSLKLINVGNFDLRNIKIQINFSESKREMRNKDKIKEEVNRTFKIYERDIPILQSQERCEIKEEDLVNFLKNRFPKKIDFLLNKKMPEEWKFKTTLIVSYYSDTLDKAPLPIVKDYEVKIKNGEIKVTRF
jgi:hypothetical protein